MAAAKKAAAKKATPKKAAAKKAAPKKATAKRAPAQAAVAKDELYHVSIEMNDEVFEAETDNLEEAILALNPPTIKTKVIFHVEHKGKSYDKLMFVPQARRVFNNKLSAKFFAVTVVKRLEAITS